MISFPIQLHNSQYTYICCHFRWDNDFPSGDDDGPDAAVGDIAVDVTHAVDAVDAVDDDVTAGGGAAADGACLVEFAEVAGVVVVGITMGSLTRSCNDSIFTFVTSNSAFSARFCNEATRYSKFSTTFT